MKTAGTMRLPTNQPAGDGAFHMVRLHPVVTDMCGQTYGDLRFTDLRSMRRFGPRADPAGSTGAVARTSAASNVSTMTCSMKDADRGRRLLCDFVLRQPKRSNS